ncbi:hypothetical protein ACS0TY_016668 [Phlomoides rotata]
MVLFYALYEALSQRGIAKKIQVIAKVRVPIINFVEKKSDVAFDLRGNDFSKPGFGPRTVILCDQCEKEYHVGCLKNCKLADRKKLPNGKWFCSTSCKWIYSALQNLLNAGAEEVPDPSLDMIKKKDTEKFCLVVLVLM